MGGGQRPLEQPTLDPIDFWDLPVAVGKVIAKAGLSVTREALETLLRKEALRGLIRDTHGSLRLPKPPAPRQAQIPIEPWRTVEHHVYPQASEFQRYWQRFKIDPDAHVLRIPENVHHQLHSAGRYPDLGGIHRQVGPGGLWNENWKQFFRAAGDHVTREEIEAQAERMIRGFDLPPKRYYYRRHGL